MIEKLIKINPVSIMKIGKPPQQQQQTKGQSSENNKGPWIGWDSRWFERKNVISKVTLLQYYVKSIHHDADQRPEWTVDIWITLAHTVYKSGIF